MRIRLSKQASLAATFLCVAMLLVVTSSCEVERENNNSGQPDATPQNGDPPSTDTGGKDGETGEGTGEEKTTQSPDGETKAPPRIAFVTNQVADFWNIAKAGCLDAQKDFDIEVDVRMPAKAAVPDQKQIVEDLVSDGIDAIAISPLDATNQKAWLNEIALKVPLITHDSDAPGSDRIMYIGMDNYLAGRMVGDLVKEALPDGGEVMLFIGRLEQNNSKLRRQGVIDVLLGRETRPDEFDPVEGELKGDKYTILDTLLDTGSQPVCKQKAADALNAFPNVDAMVGLFEYNPPAIYQALKQAGRLGEVKIIGFDENELTLQAIKDGDCVGTVVQNPYMYGYESMRVLKAILDGDNSVVPDSKFIDIPARAITASNVDEFWDDLKAKKGG